MNHRNGGPRETYTCRSVTSSAYKSFHMTKGETRAKPGRTLQSALAGEAANVRLDFSPFIRLVLGRGSVPRRHEFTHCIHEDRTAHYPQPLGLIRPGLDRLLWLSGNAQAIALLPATTNLREQTDSLPGRRKSNQPAPPGAVRERTRC
jgi:hypothetical protein